MKRPLHQVAKLLELHLVAQMVKNWHAMQKTRVRSLDQEHPLKEGMATHSCLENPMDREA